MEGRAAAGCFWVWRFTHGWMSFLFEIWEDPGGIQQTGLAQDVTHLSQKLSQQSDDDYYNNPLFSGSSLKHQIDVR